MSKAKTIQFLKNYQKSSVEKKEGFLRDFEETMIYRTTKTENPETTLSLVKEVLNKRIKENVHQKSGRNKL